MIFTGVENSVNPHKHWLASVAQLAARVLGKEVLHLADLPHKSFCEAVL
jgi:hypothetical protein